MVLIDRTYH